jgi:GH35 family endo-1,4-beta-xylanase
MRNWMQALLISALFATGANAATLNGNSLALRSTGDSSGNAWILDRNGYAGTYITLPQAGPVTITISADGSGGPSMGLGVGDSFQSFSVSAGAHNYSQTLTLPAGTHFLRTELNNDRGVGSRQLKINSLSVEGAAFANSHSNENALAASDTYINNFRQGPATVKIHGLTAGGKVAVSLKRIDFDFGAGVHGGNNEFNGELGNQGTTQQVNYQKYLNQNFNSITTAGKGYWADNEAVRGQVYMSAVDQFYSYAQTHDMHARLHNMLYEQQQPNWVDALKQQAVTSTDAKSDLLAAINSRVGYYVGNSRSQFPEIDIYNESLNSGLEGDASTYWNLYGAAGVAAIYHNAKLAGAGYSPQLFLNEYGALQDPENYGNDYMRHVETVRQAGVDAGFGEIVGGIGLQLYETSHDVELPKRMLATLQSMNIQKLPSVLTEFGTFEDVSAEDSATMLGQAMRLMFGNGRSTGITVWDWTMEDGGVGQFGPFAALYTVDTHNWNSFAITPAGKVWQDQLGIQNWDGDPNNGWTTQLTATAAADGSISFSGFYGDYELTVGGKVYQLSLTKGVTQYELGDPLALAGDFNGDGKVDAADYSVWRNHLNSTYDLHGNGNEEGGSAGRVDQADYQLWRANFGRTSGTGTGSVAGSALPEPGALSLVAWLFLLLSLRKSRRVIRA